MNTSVFERILLGFAFMTLAGCGNSDAAGPAQKAIPLVEVETPREREFAEIIEAIGTARANEQVTVSSPVTERIARLYFDDGDFVRKGQLIAVLDQSQERASLASAEASSEQARTQLQRIESLSERGFATRAQLDVQVAAAARARADSDDARARIADRTLRAPLSGAVSLRTISAGAVVSAGDAIATISDVSRIKLDFTVPETALANLHRGQPIKVRSAAYPGTAFSGTISSIDPVIDPATRAVAVRAILPNHGARLKPGMLLEVLISANRHRALSVPELAVVGEGEARFVYTVDKDGVAHRTPVTTGLRSDSYIEVAGVSDTDRVISEGVVKVVDGTQVKIAGSSKAKST